MITNFPISDNERKIIYDKATDVCKELHKIFPYCMLKYRLRPDMLYSFDIEFCYLNYHEYTTVYIDYNMMLTGQSDFLAKFMYDRYILTRITRVKMDTKNEEVNNA